MATNQSTHVDHDLAIQVQGLTKSYGKVRALRGIDLAVKRGEIFGFLGPNGAGKTTTIRCLLDSIRPDEPPYSVSSMAVGSSCCTERSTRFRSHSRFSRPRRATWSMSIPRKVVIGMPSASLRVTTSIPLNQSDQLSPITPSTVIW